MEENKRNVVRWREEIWNNRNLDIVDELAGPEYVCHLGGIPETVRGADALKQLLGTYLAAFDTRVTPEFLIAEGDMVAVHDSNWLKHTHDFQGHPQPARRLLSPAQTSTGLLTAGLPSNGLKQTSLECSTNSVSCPLLKVALLWLRVE
jgi:hypothetical protein